MDISKKHPLMVILAFTLLLFPSLLPAAPKTPPEQGRYGGVLRIGIIADPMSLDARQAGVSITSNWGFQHIYDHLVEWTEKSMGEMVPSLATEWKRADDLTWIVKLRRGVKYHNGKELTAQDVALNFDWKINSAKYQKEKGWRPAKARSSAEGLKSVEALDRYTLKFNLTHPLPAFDAMTLGWGLQYGPIDPELVEKYGRASATHPVGTGPFKFVEYVPGDHITLERFDGYWGKKPYLDKIIFRTLPDAQTRVLALQKGEIDITDISLSNVSYLKKDPNIKVYVSPSAARIYGVLLFNMRRWPMNQLKFRQALAMGTDWNKVIKAALPEGTAVYWRSLFKGSWAENRSAEKLLPSYNPQKAKELLQQVEKEGGKPIPPLYAVSRKDFGGVLGATMQIAANQLKNVGLKIDVQVVEAEVARDKIRRMSDFDFTLHSLKGPGRDPAETAKEFDSRVAVTYADHTNIPGYKNPRIDALIDEANISYDRNKRIKIYQEIEKIILTELVVLPLFNVPIVYGVRTNVNDFKPHDSGFIHLVTSWNNVWLKTK